MHLSHPEDKALQSLLLMSQSVGRLNGVRMKPKKNRCGKQTDYKKKLIADNPNGKTKNYKLLGHEGGASWNTQSTTLTTRTDSDKD